MSETLPADGDAGKPETPKRGFMSKLLSMGRGSKEPEPEDEVQVSYVDVQVWGQGLTKDEVEELNGEFKELLTDLELDATKYFNRPLEEYEAPVDVYEHLSQKLEEDGQEVDVSETLATRLGDDHPLVIELRRREALADVRLLDESIKESLGPEKTEIIYKKVPDDFHTPLDYYKELQAGAKANGLDLVPVIEAKLGKTHPLPMALRGDTEAAKANWQSMRKALTFQPQRSRGWNPALGGSAGSGVAEDKWGSLLAAAKEAKDTEGKAAAGAEEGPSASEERANVPKAAPAVAAAAATAVAPAAATAVAPAAATAVAPVATKDQLAAPKDVPPATKDAAVANGTANAAAAEQEPGKEAKDVSKEKAVVPKDGSAEIRERGILLPQPIDGKNGKGLEAVGEKPKGDDDQENKPTVANRTRGVPGSAAKDRGMRMPVRDETGGGNARGNKCCMCFGMR